MIILVTNIEISPGDDKETIERYSPMRGRVLRGNLSLGGRAVDVQIEESTFVFRRTEIEILDGYISGEKPTTEEKELISMLYPHLIIKWGSI